MALDVIALRRLQLDFEGCCSVSMTADLKLISFLSEGRDLIVGSLSMNSDVVKLSDINTYLWQDGSADSLYRLLCITSNSQNLCSYVFEVKRFDKNNESVSICDEKTWKIQENLCSFIPSVKGVHKPKLTDILRYEEKEAVICYERRYVVTLFHSSASEPQIISFADINECVNPARQLSLVKEILFILDHSGSNFYAYSVLDNSKVLEVDLEKWRTSSDEAECMQQFAVSLEKDMVVFYSSFQRLYCMTLNDFWESFSSLTAQRHGSLYPAVTAFAKQFPSVQRSDEGFRRLTVSLTPQSLQPVIIACDKKNLPLNFMTVYNGKLCFLFADDNSSLMGIHQLGSDATTSYRRLHGRGHVVQSSSQTFPLLLLHDSKLSVLLYDIEQNKLINELMMYQCGSLAEKLSNLNCWQNIVIDLEVLKQGLSNHQLDAIRFFLKTHQERYQQFLNEKELRTTVGKLKQERLSWVKITDLLFDTICCAIRNPSSRHFVEKLLQIATSCSLKLLQSIQNSMHPGDNPDIVSEKMAASSHFCKSVQQLQEISTNGSDPEVSNDGNVSSKLKIHYPLKVVSQWAQWDEKLLENVFREALIQGKVALAQSYVLNSCDAGREKWSDFKQLCNFGDGLVSQFLKQGQLSEAVIVLQNLGIPVNEKLSDIFRSTCDADVRNLLVGELRKRHVLNERDEKDLTFLSCLENLYPCTSFEHAKLLQEERSAYLEEWYKCAFVERDSSTSGLVIGDSGSPSWSNCETEAYCRIALRSLSLWPDEVRERILLPHFLKGSCYFDVHISSTTAWNYLLEYGDLPLILKWISDWLGLLSDHSTKEFPYGWILNEGMTNSVIQTAPLHAAESTLNELARYGVFSDDELEDISAVLSRAGRSCCDLTDPSVFSSSKATLSFIDFSHRVIHYCLKHNLIHFLYEFWRKSHERFITWPTCQLCDVPLLKMVKAFGMWSQNTQDAYAAYTAMLTTAEHIYGVYHLTPKTILTNIPSPLNVAILLYYPGSLCTIIKENLSSDADVKMFKCALRSYPLLYDCFFKPDGDQMLPEVSLYKLLQGNTLFNISRLFGWQSTNTLKSEDSFLEIPHFSMNTLCEQHGMKEALTHFYYLNEGRPNFAYLKFLAQEISKENRLTLPRVHLACKQVFNFALSQFCNEKVCASSIVFHELLGQDSLPLRICQITANLLYEILCSKQESESSKQKIFSDVSILFQNSIEDKLEALHLIKLLEREVFQKWKSHCVESSFEDLTQWIPLMALANYYEIPAGETYLQACAEKDDWLRFMIFAQIFQVPKVMVINAASKFSNQCIGNHLCKALEKRHHLSSNSDLSEKDHLRRKTDLRKSLYARLGVVKDVKDVPTTSQESMSAPESEDEGMSVCSEGTSVSSESEASGEPVAVMKDLLTQVLYAHNTENPWTNLLQASYATRNPVLSVLAASYPDSDVLLCFTTWLSAALPPSKDPKVQKMDNTQKRMISWTENDFQALVCQAIRDRKILILALGFYLFLPSTPLFALTEFLVTFLVYRKLDFSASKLKKFQNQLWDYKEANEELDNLHSLCYSLDWIEKISVLILKETVVNCTNDYERQLLFRHYAFTRIDRTFSREVDVPMFSKLYQMLQCLGDSEDRSQFEYFLLPQSHPDYKNACWRCVARLIKSQSFNDARVFAGVAELPMDEVLVLQMKQESEEMKKTNEWKVLGNRVSFWKNAMSTMKQNNVSSSRIIAFLKNCCQASEHFGEKCFLMQLIIECQMEIFTYDFDEMYSLRTRMWEWCVKEAARQPTLEELDIILPTGKAAAFYDENFEGEPLNITLRNEKEIDAVERIICLFLKKKSLNQAFQVAQIFHHTCYDLNIVTVCLKLAKGEIDPKSVVLEDHTPTASPSRRKKSVFSWSSCARDDALQEDVIHAIENFCTKTDAAASICEQILFNYVTCVVLNCHYDEVANETSPFSVLKRVLASNYKEKYSLAKSLMDVYELSDEVVAKYLSQEIYFSIRMIPETAVLLPDNKLALADEESEILYNPAFSDEAFQLTVKLCQDPSLIGKKMLDLMSSVFDDYEISTDNKSLLELVELCVCAHNCFTAACNVEGISQVLHKSKRIAAALTKSSNFSLLVRLLTGIGRYSEMRYIFDMLLENGKFELLFGVRMKNVPNLRLALLDYLKRCPDAEHYYSMLLETFNMYREIAEDAEMSARKRLAQLSKMDTDAGLTNELEYVMKELTHAAKNYMQVNCLKQAQLCANLARLVALQIHLHPEWIIGLNETSISDCIVRLTHFSQAVIVSEAYSHNRSWSQAVFNNVIIKENRSYLEDLHSYMGVSESLVREVAKSFQSLSSKTETQVRNMKWILSYCVDIEFKYRIANQLGFSDVTAELMMGEGGAFLQDCIVSVE